MADANANIRIDVDTTEALSQIKALQRQISLFHTSMAQSGKAAAAQSAKMQASLVNGINATQGFSAQMVNIKTATESFTNSLEKNKFSMGQYFRYAGASTKTFGKLFKTEFATITKVARERTKDLQTQYIKMGRDANGAMKAIKVRPTTLDLKNLGTQTAIAAQKQQLFNQLVRQGSTNLLNWGKNTQWAGRQLMVGFTIPLTIMGATAAREFMKLEEQAIRFKRVYGDMFTTNKQTDKALEDVRRLAKEFTKFGVSVEETVGLAASVAQMGAMGADLTNQVTEATRLAVLGGIEQQEALDTTISLTNAFGLATDQLAGKIAFLNAAENQTILSIEDFNEAIPKAGSVVKQLGGDVEDLAYFLTAMREGGINASQSANALKSSLARLINPTEVSIEKMSGFGIDILGVVNDNAGNLKKTIQVLAVELDKLDPLNKSRAIEQLFGKFQFARMSTLFENIVKDGSQANKILELTTSSTEELAIIAERELGRVSDSPMYKFKKAIEEFQVSLAPIGEAFLKLATPVIEFGNRVMEQFNSLSDGTKQFITGAVAIGGVVAPALIMVVGLLANGLANTIKFGALVSNALRGASQSSNVLTEQFNYMNSEQIEAAAVAASLDQVHAKLRQTFTAEAAAVDKLTAAYTRAIAKQNQMKMGGAVSKGRATKGYNAGVRSVPGPKGAGDIVPAMLSPGEAVIPAKKARKYSGLIDAMFNDRLPGYRFGLNPFKGMMSRSRVATRMPSQSLFTALNSKDLRYKSAFETGTGADYLTKHGLPNKAQAQMRMRMERDFMGNSPGMADSARPTYGSVATTGLVARLLNMILGGRRGARFNAATNPMSQSLDKYGDVSLIGKRGMARRSQAFVGDSLLQYSRFPQAMMPGGRRAPMPMRGATQSQMTAAGMSQFNYVPGSNTRTPEGFMQTNLKVPYIESYTKGGFNFNEIDKIIAKDPAIRRQLKSQLRSAGLKGVKVQGEGFASSLFRALGVPGFKEGILSIPGSGNEDKFPAMLAPGEAVIPADKAKKYRGFIEQMIAGNVPGFRSGTSNFAHIGPGSQVPVSQALADSNLVPTQAVKLRMQTLQDLNPNAPVNLKHAYGVKMSSQTNNLLGKMSGAGVDQVASEFTGKNIEDRYGEMLGLTGDDAKDPQLQKEFANYDKAMSNKLKGLKKTGIQNIVDTEEQWKQLPKAQQKTTRSLESLDKEVAKEIGKDNKKFIKARKTGLSTVRDIRIGEGLTAEDKAKAKANPKRYGRLLRATDSKSGGIRVGTSNQRKTRGGFGSMPTQAKSYNDGLAASAQTASESKRTKKIAKDTVDGYANELERGKKRVASTAKKQTQAQLKAEETARKRSDAARKGWETRRANQEAAMMAPAAGAAARRRGGRMAGIGTKFRGMGGRMAMAGGGLASVAMMGSMMPGKAGEVSQKLMMPLMALSMMLPMLTNPLGLVVAGIGGLAVGIIAINNHFNKLAKNSYDLAMATGASSQAINDFAEYAGKVTAGEQMDRRRDQGFDVFQTAAGKSDFGSNFLESDPGKQMYESFAKIYEERGGAAAQDAMVNQMATAVASGALDPNQARDIVAALGKEMGDFTFSINVNSRLLSLLGPNGENLLNDPLSIRLEILSNSRENIDAYKTQLEAANVDIANGLDQTGFVATAGAVAASVTAIGLALAPFTAGLSALAAGAIVLGTGAAAATGAYFATKEQFEMSAEAMGGFAAASAIALQNQQEMLDSLQLEYEQRIANAQAAGDAAKAAELETEYLESRNEILMENAKAIDSIQSTFNSVSDQQGMLDQYKTLTEEIYKDDPLMKAALKGVEADLSKLDDEQEVVLRASLLSQDLSPVALQNMLAGEDFETDVELFIKLGAANAATADQIASLFGDDGAASKFKENVTSQADPVQAEEYMNSFKPVIQALSAAGEDALSMGMQFYLENPEILEDANTEIQEFKNQVGDEPITLDIIQKVYGQELVDQVKLNQAYFDSLPEDQKVVYTTVLRILGEMDPAAKEAAAINFAMSGKGAAAYKRLTGLDYNTAQSALGGNTARSKAIEAYDSYYAETVTSAGSPVSGADGDGTDTPGTGGGPKASAFDGLLTKLRDVRDATISMKKGFAAATAELDKIFDGGKKSIDVFDGLANQMRRLGAGEGIINAVLGMDPAEYEERKDELFNFDKNGKITGLTSKFKSLAAAIGSIAIGDYVNDQEQFIANTNDQFTAMNKLVGAGMSFVDAYEMVANQALATRIAMAGTTEELERLLQISELLNKTNEKKKTIDEEAQAVKAVKRTNEEFRNRYVALGKIAKEGSGLSDDQITEILSDPNLTKLYLNPSLDPGTLEQRLRQAEAKANLELRLKVATDDGKEAIFDEAMGEIFDQFARKEQEIEVDFRLETEDDSDIVRDAQNKIASIQFEIDDYQAQLKGIADQEEEINDKYDKRYEALEKVATAQEAISRAQKAQLTIADALSRGDIAAAARAQQELRDQEAEASREEKRAQLERAQEAELANVRSKSGKSRQELEDAVKAKQDEIFNIEENTLEPAEERIRQAEYAKEVAIDGLEIQGRTRDMWEKISNQVDLATVNAEEFAKSIERALALYEYFVNGKPLDLALFGEGALQDLVNNYGVNPDDTYNSGDDEDDDEPDITEIIPDEVLDLIDNGQGDEVDEDQLTARQLAAKNLYEVTRDKDGTMKTVRDELGIDDATKTGGKSRASRVTLGMAKNLGIVSDSGQMLMTADRAEAVMQGEMERLYKQEQAKRDREASLAYAKTVYGVAPDQKIGNVSADRLDRAYNRDITSQGLSTNVGNGAAERAAQEAAAKRAAAAAEAAAQKRRDDAKAAAARSRAEQAAKAAAAKRAAEAAAQKRRDAALAAAARSRAEQAAKAAAAKRAADAAKRKKAVDDSRRAFENSGMSLRAYMRSAGGPVPGYSVGGSVKGYAAGGMFRSLGTDNVPAMLTPGEFVIRRPAAQSIGIDNLENLNKTGTYNDGSVYNYNLAVNVSSMSDPDKIARTVMKEIKRVESQRVRGNRF